MSGAVIPLPQYDFMAWRLVKSQGQLYLYLLYIHVSIEIRTHNHSVRAIQDIRGNSNVHVSPLGTYIKHVGQCLKMTSLMPFIMKNLPEFIQHEDNICIAVDRTSISHENPSGKVSV